MERAELIENSVHWAEERLGSRDYAGWCLAFIEDALLTGIPERGSFVFYDCLCPGEDGPVNWGHCGIGLGDGRVIHAWDAVRIDDYLQIQELTALTGDRPRYIGWVPVERVLAQRP